MAMIALYILALRIIFVPFASTESDIPCVICSFFGVENQLTHTLPVDDIPNGCKTVNFGAYYFNETQSQENIDTIACLVSANHDVYTAIAAYDFWNDILTTDIYDDEIENMAQFMVDNNVTGIYLDLNSATYDLGIPDIANKVNDLVCKIKATAPDLKVGMLLNGVQCSKFSQEDLFSYTVANCAIDLYIIYTGDIGIPCWEDAALEDSLPISHNDSQYVSLDQVCHGVAASCMDKDKVIIDLPISVGVGMVKEQTLGLALEYPQYCCLSQSDMDNDTHYCPDSIDIYEKRASYVKDYAKGIFIHNLDMDYWNDDCGCERYLITNTMIDAFGCN